MLSRRAPPEESIPAPIPLPSRQVRGHAGGRATLLALALTVTSSTAGAFCRMTTCDAAGSPSTRCATDEQGCATTGKPLYWPTRCLSFGVEQHGSAKRHLSYRDLDTAVGAAFGQWLAADCAGQPPSFRVWDFGRAYGPMVCDAPEFNRDAPNANVWMFRDRDWPYTAPAAALALTTLTFESDTGRILDADVEINSFGVEITLSPQGAGDDLQSIVTHEAGHFLGLGPSEDPTATMYGSYPADQLTARSLSSDDVSAVCAAYPPTRSAPSCDQAEPVHGFSRYCAPPAPARGGCTLAPGAARPTRIPAATLAVGALVVIAGTRRARRAARL
jgi:hypothetical protein